MDEREFNDLSEQIFVRIERGLEANDEALDCERLAGGNLEIACPDDSVVIVSRHVVNREIWVAARAGGFHFRLQDGVWSDTRDGAELLQKLSGLLTQQAGETVHLSWE